MLQKARLGLSHGTSQSEARVLLIDLWALHLVGRIAGMQSLETSSCLGFILKDYLWLYRLAHLKVMPLLNDLNVLIESSYVAVSLAYLLLVLADLVFQFLYLPSLMVNQALLAGANALAPMKLESQLIDGSLSSIELGPEILQELHLLLQLTHSDHEVIELHSLDVLIVMLHGRGRHSGLAPLEGLGRRGPDKSLRRRWPHVKHGLLMVRVVNIVD